MRECSKCSTSKEETEFVTRGKTIRGICKSCENFRKKELRSSRRIEAIELLGSECNECGSNTSLEFHHIETKEDEISDLRGYSKKRFMKEVAKCILLCKRCHIKEHE